MAKENTAILYGVVNTRPRITVNQNNDFLSGTVMIITARRSQETDLILSGKIRYNKIMLYTKNPDIIRVMASLSVGDLVFAKGSLCTKMGKKAFTCPACHKKIIIENSTSSYVEPIFLKKWEEKQTEKESQALIDQATEISNMVFLWGYVCKLSDFYNASNKKEFSFQLAVNRKRRITGSDDHSDYPWVECFGHLAEQASQEFKVGSEVYIHGGLQGRDIVRKVYCDSCNMLVPVKDYTIDVVPYTFSTEENTSFLYGSVVSNPRFQKDRSGNVVSARFFVTTSRRIFVKNMNIIEKFYFSKTLIYVKNPNVLQNLLQNPLMFGDMVFIKGSFSSLPSKKQYSCPVCHEKIVINDQISYFIEPVFLKKWESECGQEKIISLLKESTEISNQMFLAGYVDSVPSYIEAYSKKESTFAFAFPKRRHPERDQIYYNLAFVQTFGDMAEELYKILHQNSRIYINGDLYRLEQKTNVYCESCHFPVPITESDFYLRPHSVEYLENCDKTILWQEEELDML